MPHAVIIGHTGQDGRILRQQLLLAGYSVTGASQSEVLRGEAVSAPLDFTVPSIALDFIGRELPDEIYVLAARHHSSQEHENDPLLAWRQSWDVNVELLVNVLHAVSRIRHDARVFYASSSRVFGRTSLEIQDESTPVRPECVYGVTKAAGMLVAHQYRVQYGLHVCCGIMYNHESPQRGSAFISQRVVEGLVAVAAGQLRTLAIGDLSARVDWGYAPDFTLAMQAMVRHPKPMDYVVATGITHSVKDLVQLVSNRLGLDWRECVVESKSLLTRPVQGLRGDAKLLRENTGWKPSVDFDGMINLMVDAAIARNQA